jgi:O-antigen ligase
MLLPGAVAVALMLWLLVIALGKPRLLTYAIIGFSPTQFIFVPVATFFLSPADLLVIAGGAAFVVRLASRDPASRTALWRHRYIVLMLVAYLLGFLVLGVFSRTLVRVLMAVVPSILACELFRTHHHLKHAATALVIAGIVDASYGLVFYAMGTPIYPGRFSGMSGVNFSATVIITGAAVLFAQYARATRWTTLARPGGLTLIGLATLSQMGVIALLTAWLVVLRRVMTPRNIVRIGSTAALLAGFAQTVPAVREQVAGRNQRGMGLDGVQRNSADVRWMVLRTAADAVRDSPFVGIGYSRFQAYSLSNPEINRSTAGVGYGTHNTYMEVLVEGGVVALLCFGLHFLQYFRGVVGTLRSFTRQKDTIAASALVGLPIVLVAAALANVLLVYHFWAVCGLALASLSVRRREMRLGIAPSAADWRLRSRGLGGAAVVTGA